MEIERIEMVQEKWHRKWNKAEVIAIFKMTFHNDNIIYASHYEASSL